MRKIKYVLGLALVFCLMLSTAAYGTGTVDVTVSGTEDFSGAHDVHKLINSRRTEAGLGSLYLDKQLTDLAMERACELSLYFSHSRPNGTMTPYYEIIGIGYPTAQAVIDAWMASPGHHDAIMDADDRMMGVGCFSSEGTTTWIVIFSKLADGYTAESRNGISSVHQQVEILPSYVEQDNVSTSSYSISAGKTMQLHFDATNHAYKSGHVGLLPIVSDIIGADGSPAITFSSLNDGSGTVIMAAHQPGTYTIHLPTYAGQEPHSIIKLTVMEPLPFDDVDDNAWYSEALRWAYKNSIVDGGGTFAPDSICTRAQAVTYLYRTLGSPEFVFGAEPFDDVKRSDFFHDSVLWSAQNGIVTGTSETTFSPQQGITRSQVVTLLWRMAGQPQTKTAVNPFHDVSPNSYYHDAVLWAVENGITRGTAKHSFSPDEGCTRGQMVSFLHRISEQGATWLST